MTEIDHQLAKDKNIRCEDCGESLASHSVGDKEYCESCYAEHLTKDKLRPPQ